MSDERMITLPLDTFNEAVNAYIAYRKMRGYANFTGSLRAEMEARTDEAMAALPVKAQSVEGVQRTWPQGAEAAEQLAEALDEFCVYVDSADCAAALARLNEQDRGDDAAVE